MYAIIESGGKQYRVAQGDVLRLERLPGAEGDEITFERVLALQDGERFEIGTPTVAGARVIGRVLGHGRAKKIRIFKYKPKKNYRRRAGHRQPFTRVVIETIQAR